MTIFVFLLPILKIRYNSVCEHKFVSMTYKLVPDNEYWQPF